MTYITLGKLVGLSPAGAGHYVRGNLPIGMDVAAKFATALDCKITDILPDVAGLDLVGPERELIEDYRSLSELNKQEMLRIARRLADSEP